MVNVSLRTLPLHRPKNSQIGPLQLQITQQNLIQLSASKAYIDHIVGIEMVLLMQCMRFQVSFTG